MSTETRDFLCALEAISTQPAFHTISSALYAMIERERSAPRLLRLLTGGRGSQAWGLTESSSTVRSFSGLTWSIGCTMVQAKGKNVTLFRSSGSCV